MRFKNRNEAGILLARQLKKYKNKKDVIVMAIPRGGIVVGFELAKFLNAKLDIIVTKKIGLQGNEEFAIGAVGPDKQAMLDDETIRIYNVDKDYLKKIRKEIGNEIERRYKAYKGKYTLANAKNKTIIITDDGIATGLTIKSAVQYLRNNKVKKIIVAVPVAPTGFEKEIKGMADEFICLHLSATFFAVGQFYDEFEQLNDKDVKRYLNGSVQKQKRGTVHG